MKLPTEKRKPKHDLSTKSTLIYGPPKIGKSTLASQFPESLFFECEPGLNELEVYSIPTYDWGSFLQAAAAVVEGNHKFKTIVVDTVDNAFKFCSEYTNKKLGVEYEGDADSGKGWTFAKNEWHRVLTKLAGLDCGLVLISHSTDKKVETRVGEYTKTQPTLPDRARNIVLGIVDMILYCDVRQVKGEEGTTFERIIRTKPHATYEAGDRSGRLPPVLPMSYEALAKAYNTGEGLNKTDEPKTKKENK